MAADQCQVLEVLALLADEEERVQVDLVHVGQLQFGDLVAAVLDQAEEMVPVEVAADQADLAQGVQSGQEVEAVRRLRPFLLILHATARRRRLTRAFREHERTGEQNENKNE